MTKSELTQALADQMNLSMKDAKSIVDTIVQTMSDALVEGRSVELRGFGSFQVRDYDSYTGRNPKTGNLIKVKPKRLPFFKVGKDLREKVNGEARQQ
jgi:integration host factor subunit beta